MRGARRVAEQVAMAALLVGVFSARSGAQVFEAVGARAQGMGGAFVGVADDATASWWNPAGLATGAYFNAVLERGRTTEPADPNGATDLRESGLTTSGFSVAFPALGLSYYRLRVSEVGPASSTAPPADGRQDLGGADRVARSLDYSQFGATVGQSLGDHFVVGSTVKLLRAGVVSLPASSVADSASPLEAADDLSAPLRTRFGLDMGAMASFHVVRFGVTVRNLREVNIGSAQDPLRLKRQARAGIALLAGKHGLLDAVTVAGDADLTRTDTLLGEVRHVAGGAEAWLFTRHLGVRGGVTGNSFGEIRPVGSVGLSVAPKSGFYIEGALSRGRDASLRGWTTSIRVTY